MKPETKNIKKEIKLYLKSYAVFLTIFAILKTKKTAQIAAFGRLTDSLAWFANLTSSIASRLKMSMATVDTFWALEIGGLEPPKPRLTNQARRTCYPQGKNILSYFFK